MTPIPTLRLAAVLELLDNTSTAEDLAARHGVTVAEVEAWRSLYVAGLRQASSGQAPLQRRARTGLKLGLLAAGVSLLVGGVAWAQLVTFAADTPARATLVNANFTFLQNWIERKVGPLYTTGTGADQVRIGATQDVGTSGTAGGLIVGNTGGLNLGLDGNELQARNGNAASALTLNRRGGTVTVGSSSSSVSVPGALTAGSISTTGSLSTTGTLSAGAIARSGGGRFIDIFGALNHSGTFTSSGGQVLLFVSGSGYGPANTVIGMEAVLDGTPLMRVDAYTNEANSHKTFVPRMLNVGRLSAGTHTLLLRPIAGTSSDGNDFFNATYLELP